MSDPPSAHLHHWVLHGLGNALTGLLLVEIVDQEIEVNSEAVREKDKEGIDTEKIQLVKRDEDNE